MSEERLKILQLLSDGKITAEQAADLLAAEAAAPPTPDPVEAGAVDAGASDALKAAKSAEFPNDNTIRIVETDLEGDKETKVSVQKIDRAENGSKPRWLRIRVQDTTNDRRKVKIDIPIGLIKFGMRIGRRFSPDLEGVEWSEIEEMVSSAEAGLLVNVEDEDEHVQIYVE